MSLSADLQAKLQKQVEFYFSDVNIAKDVFLKAKMAESAEGFIPLAVLLTFNRVNAVTKDAKVLAESIKASPLLVVDEENLQVRRAQPLPESIQTDAETVYVKPVPANSTLEDLQEFFGKFGTVRAVWRRYFGGANKETGSNTAKQSVFVVFGTKEEAEKFKNEPPQFDGAQLLVQWKLEYLQRKAEEMAAKSKLKAASKVGSAAASSSNTRTTPEMPKSASYTISGVGEIEKFSSIKGLWPAEEQKGVRYVFMPDKETAQVIFQDEQTGTVMTSDLEKRGTTLNGKVPSVKKLEGADETDLLANVEKEISERAAQNNGSRGGGRGGRGGARGGRGGGRGGKRPRE
ncbi:LA RNA-binding protein, putative [Bodo saltans]|uniref:LA RNA-binding protein, putative n=1 Tax=Bodo saltans TaxID=75058 RepID=A0A0S4JIJ0_BODSA|nr:LA RNA-binding protein, putative [Bodo saltans]|eukprot:CUG89981.1 LA RNA-binding protein, putative [Bodo saltans]